METAIEILIAAHTFTLVDLEEHCVEFIIDHYEIFVSDQGFSKLASTHNSYQYHGAYQRPKKRRSFRNGSVDEHSTSNSNGRAREMVWAVAGWLAVTLTRRHPSLAALNRQTWLMGCQPGPLGIVYGPTVTATLGANLQAKTAHR